MPSANGSSPFTRLEQVQDVARTFLSNFGRPFDHKLGQEEFLSVYDPNIEWFDHAFQICRIGHDAVLGLRDAFLHCNQPFISEAKAILPTADGVVIEQIWKGCCANDIVRPNGNIAVKASGKDFQCHVCMILKINQSGMITRIDEYYNKAWDEGVLEGEYPIVKASYSKRI